MAVAGEGGRDRITLAIFALGGQGGGVLADWILDIAAANGYVAQGTSVPGVAQRTGATVYYIEMAKRAASSNEHTPVLALMPAPGDVDIVVASELMEAGRAILRGFVSAERTTLIGSIHRVYAIAEKSARGDGLRSGERIVEAAHRRAARFIGFDMEQAATEAGSVISSVMLGALAASEALPFGHDQFEAAIRRGGKAIEANLKGFSLGLERALHPEVESASPAEIPEPTSVAGRRLAKLIQGTFPEPVQPLAMIAAARLIEYQDAAYADLYLDRLRAIHAVDDGSDDWRLMRATARHLALWMTYEDTIRVADLKVRLSRHERIGRENDVRERQMVRITDYLHPRVQEICDILPARIGAAILNSPRWSAWLARWFSRGRHIETTRLRWYLALRLITGLRPWRRRTLRYRTEQARIEAWLALARQVAGEDVALAAEVIATQRLLKGYSDTFERGLARFETTIGAAWGLLGRDNAAAQMQILVETAIDDEDN